MTQSEMALVARMREHQRLASAAIHSHLAPTPLKLAASLSGGGMRVYLKLEQEQPTGSFKVRGALYALRERARQGEIAEVVAASTGNHGAAVAYAARLVGIRATIFLPERANPVKVQRIRELGAVIRECGRTVADASDVAAAHAANIGAYLLADATDSNVPVGAGTIIGELLQELPRIDEIMVPIGDSALIRGIGAALVAAGHVRTHLMGVQSENAPAYYRSWVSGRAEQTEARWSIADGLMTTRPVAENVATLRMLVHDIVLVSDQDMLAAMEWLAAKEQVIAEPAGAAATAAFQKRGFSGAENVVLLVTGGNVAPSVRRQAQRHCSSEQGQQ